MDILLRGTKCWVFYIDYLKYNLNYIVRSNNKEEYIPDKFPSAHRCAFIFIKGILLRIYSWEYQLAN